MSQLIACRCPEGLVLAADRRVVVRGGAGDSGGLAHAEPEPQPEPPPHGQTVRDTRKLYALGSRSVVASLGAAVGIEVSERLARRLAKREPSSFAALAEQVLETYQLEYATFLRDGSAWFAAHPEALQLSYVVLAGVAESGPPELRFFGSESHAEPIGPLPVGDILVAPRRLGIESRLARATMTGASLLELRDLVVEGMELITAGDADVGGGFDVAVIESERVSLSSVS